MTRVVVFGAGAVGGYLAWRFAQARADVSLVARGAHLEAIRADGLTLEVEGVPAGAVNVAASDDPESLGPQDVVLVTLKHAGIAPALEGLRAFSSPATIFAFATNGIPWWMEPELDLLDPGGQLARMIVPSLRVGCVGRISAEVVRPGVVGLATGSARFILGPASRQAAGAAASVAKLLESAGIAVNPVDDLRPAVWDKLFLNTGFGMLATILGLPVGQVTAQPEAQKLLIDLLGEIRALAKSRGVEMTLPDSIVMDPAIRASPHLPSLLQDLLKGRPAEIDALVNAPLSLARRAGLATPVLDHLGALVTAKARAFGSYDGDGHAT